MRVAAAIDTPGPRRQLSPLPKCGRGILPEHCRYRLGIRGCRPDPVAGATARPSARLGECAARRLSPLPGLGNRYRGLVPRRCGHERRPSGARRRRVEDRPGETQRRALLLPDDHLVVRGPDAFRPGDRAAGAAVRDHPGPPAPRAAPPAPARLRDHLLGRASRGIDAGPDRARDRGGGRWSRSSPDASSPSGSGSSRGWRSSASRPGTRARSPPGSWSGGSAGSRRSGSFSRPFTWAARSRTCSW